MNPIDRKIKESLSDFKQAALDEQNSRMFMGFYKFSIDGDFDENRLIRYLLVKFLGFEVWDKPIEKVNWEIPFEYQDIPAAFAHQKFGFRLYLDKNLGEGEAKLLFDEICLKIKNCLKIIEPIIREEGLRALKKGEVIVENKLSSIERQFEFFLKESKRKEKKANVSKVTKLSENATSISLPYWGHSEYLLDAACMAFFSLLEHLCILGLAFTDSKERFKFEEYSKKTWKEKFKVVFPLEIKEFADYYNSFQNLAKYRRNPAAHGFLDKLHIIFDFYLPEAAHRIPMGLFDKELFYKSRNKESISSTESFMSFIRKHPKTKMLMRHLDAGFDIYYHKDALLEYQGYMKLTDSQSKGYIEYHSYTSDNMANMDW